MESYESSGTITAVKPVAVKGEDVPDYRLPPPKTYSYRLGNDLLIHPVIQGGTDKSDDLGSVVHMTFPAEGQQGESNTWLSWWTPHDKKESITVNGGEEFTKSVYVSIDSFPVYVRKGSYLPLYQSSSDMSLMFTWFAPSPDSESSSYVREAASEGTGYESGISLSNDGMLSGWLSAHAKSKPGYGWKIIGVSKPENVSFKANDVSTCGWTYEDSTQTLTLSCLDASEGLIFEAFGVQSTF